MTKKMTLIFDTCEMKNDNMTLLMISDTCDIRYENFDNNSDTSDIVAY